MTRASNAKRRAIRANRRGYSMVFFAMFLFGFMALAALVIDVGFARLTQRQLQGAAESAALEGLRGAGADGFDEVTRRPAASRFVEWHFDDDLNPANGDDGAFDSGSGRFGAGPLVEFSGGAGDPSMVAGQLMTVDPANPVHQPQLSDGVSSADGFRVTLQRGSNSIPAADLYSMGPAVPYLFARGSLLDRGAIAQGVTVRGPGVSREQPALTIGRGDDSLSPRLPGLLPFALELNYWNGLITAQVPADEQTVVGGEIGTVGRCFDLGAVDSLPLMIGRMLPPAAVPDDGFLDGYVPIYTSVSNGIGDTLRVVGFGRVQAEVSTVDTTQVMHVTPLPQQVAAENASAVLCYRLALSSTELAAILAANATIAEPLQAPASGSYSE